MQDPIEKYTALVIQPHIKVAENRSEISENLDRLVRMIDFGVGYFWEVPVRLVVLPEYALQGVTTPGKGEHGLDDFMKKAILADGPEVAALAEKAKEYGLYLCAGGIIEQLPEFPDRWFNTVLILGPDGTVVLRYHKYHINPSLGLGTSPHDMWDAYTEVFGDDLNTLFPVVRTEIGNLGAMTCHDGATPEVSRALGFNGVEVLCHPTAMQEVEGVSEPWDFWLFTRRTRAHDNMCYLLGSNWGSVDYQYYPKAFCPGHSLMIDYTGMVMRYAPYPEEQVLAATIDIEALREHRTHINHNLWVDVRTEAFKSIYAKPIFPPNQFPPGNPPRNLAAKMEGTYDSMRQIYDRGQFVMPYDKRDIDPADVVRNRVENAKTRGLLRKD